MRALNITVIPDSVINHIYLFLDLRSAMHLGASAQHYQQLLRDHPELQQQMTQVREFQNLSLYQRLQAPPATATLRYQPALIHHLSRAHVEQQLEGEATDTYLTPLLENRLGNISAQQQRFKYVRYSANIAAALMFLSLSSGMLGILNHSKATAITGFSLGALSCLSRVILDCASNHCFKRLANTHDQPHVGDLLDSNDAGSSDIGVYLL